MAEPIVFDLDVNNEKALLAFDESIRGMAATKAQSEQLIAAMGGIEKVAEAAGVSTAKAAKLIEQSVKQAASKAIQAEQEVAKARERAAREAEAAAKRLAREQEKAAEKARRAAEMAGNSWGQIAKRMQSNQVISDIEQLGGMFIMAGGAASKFGMLLSSLVRPVAMLGTMLGPAGPVVLGLLAIPAAALASAAALKALADGAADARKELEEMGQRVTNKQAQQLDEYGESTERLTIAMDKLWVAVGAPIAAQLADIALMAAASAEKMQLLAKAVEIYVDQQAPLQKLWTDGSHAAHHQAETLALLQRTTSASMAAGAKAAAENKKLLEEESKLRTKFIDEEIAEAKRREKEAARDAKQRREEEKRTQEALHDIVASGMDELMSEEGKIYAARNERIRQLEELEISEAQAASAILMINEQTEAQLQQLYQKRWDDAKEKRDKAYEDEKADAERFARETAQIIKDNEKELNDFLKKQREEEVALALNASLQIVQDATSMYEQLTSMSLDQHQSELDRLKDRRAALVEQLKDAEKGEKDLVREKIKALDEETAARRKQARRAFNDSQAAAIASVIASGAAAYAAMLITFAALGPFAPVAAAGVVAPSIGAQLAVIAQNKPPAHSGKAFGADEFFVGDQMVRQGEGGVIFNQRAMETGAQQRAMAENEGRSPTSAAPAQLVLADSGRVIAATVVRDARRPSSPFASAFGTVKTGVVDPYRKGR